MQAYEGFAGPISIDGHAGMQGPRRPHTAEREGRDRTRASKAPSGLRPLTRQSTAQGYLAGWFGLVWRLVVVAVGKEPVVAGVLHWPSEAHPAHVSDELIGVHLRDVRDARQQLFGRFAWRRLHLAKELIDVGQQDPWDGCLSPDRARRDSWQAGRLNRGETLVGRGVQPCRRVRAAEPGVDLEGGG